MRSLPKYPSLYEINTRVWLRALSDRLGRRITLADVPDAEIDRLADRGFDWVWLMSVWQTGTAGRAVSRSRPDLREEYRRLLPDLKTEDICGSGFAITGYAASQRVGGDAALAAFRQRLAARGIRLMLDFVPNHTAPDHPWVTRHPSYYVRGTEADLQRTPGNYVRIDLGDETQVFAYGRDPYFPGWSDTLQLDYGNPVLQAARRAELVEIAGRCDGVRCDMAMLIVPEVFERTWGIPMQPFWPEAITATREAVPGFVLMAEVYWDMEWTLQTQGFDYCYDKRLYDRLAARYARPVREHLIADLDYQRRLARFLENHDEPRAAAAYPLPVHKAAAVVTFFAPGLRFFNDGQLEGHRLRLPTHLCRGPAEPTDEAIAAFYDRLLEALKSPLFRDGDWSRLDPLPAWAGNWSCDAFIAYAWQGADGTRALVVINYEDAQGQCHLRLPFPDLAGRKVRLSDVLGSDVYDRDGSALVEPGPGLYIDLGPWGCNVFRLGDPT
ncbi:MAG: alpha-amylase family glycosyl hydrolase [Rhodospirillales bacterium]